MSRLFDDEVLDAPATAAGQEQRPEAPRERPANRKQVQLRPCDLESQARGPRPEARGPRPEARDAKASRPLRDWLRCPGNGDALRVPTEPLSLLGARSTIGQWCRK